MRKQLPKYEAPTKQPWQKKSLHWSQKSTASRSSHWTSEEASRQCSQLSFYLQSLYCIKVILKGAEKAGPQTDSSSVPQATKGLSFFCDPQGWHTNFHLCNPLLLNAHSLLVLTWLWMYLQKACLQNYPNPNGSKLHSEICTNQVAVSVHEISEVLDILTAKHFSRIPLSKLAHVKCLALFQRFKPTNNPVPNTRPNVLVCVYSRLKWNSCLHFSLLFDTVSIVSQRTLQYLGALRWLPRQGRKKGHAN